jgi:hypothetical protein
MVNRDRQSKVDWKMGAGMILDRIKRQMKESCEHLRQNSGSGSAGASFRSFSRYCFFLHSPLFGTKCLGPNLEKLGPVGRDFDGILGIEIAQVLFPPEIAHGSLALQAEVRPCDGNIRRRLTPVEESHGQ